MSNTPTYNRPSRGDITATPPPVFQRRNGPFTADQAPGIAAWFRFNRGITITGSGVSQWSDMTGNGRHLKQGTDANRPAKQGDGSILFDGSNDALKCDAFTFAQPCTFYLLMKNITWANNLLFCDGDTAASTIIRTRDVGGATPEVQMFAGTNLGTVTDIATGSYGVVCAVFNGASSVLQENSGIPVTGNAGASNPGGFTLASLGSAGANSNIQVKEVLLYAAAHDAATRAKVIAYLNSV